MAQTIFMLLAGAKMVEHVIVNGSEAIDRWRSTIMSLRLNSNEIQTTICMVKQFKGYQGFYGFSVSGGHDDPTDRRVVVIEVTPHGPAKAAGIKIVNQFQKHIKDHILSMHYGRAHYSYLVKKTWPVSEDCYEMKQYISTYLSLSGWHLESDEEGSNSTDDAFPKTSTAGKPASNNNSNVLL
uniref:PDZ domain-containing protein n=1 Tax=Ditylenchus dipsaci TaxID=166011 RepID=A0A915E5R5_9BILA